MAAADEPPPPTIRAQVYSSYEQKTLDITLGGRNLTLDPSPEGKILEGIDIATLDVIVEGELAPRIINVLHATTKHYVIEREILLRPGQPYRAVAVEESVRNLRTFPQLSLVEAVAVRGSAPNKVRLLVITKDVWSLRLGWDLQLSTGGIEDFILQPSETNFLGTHQIAALYFELDPATFTYGAGYHVPRLEGTRNVLDAAAQVIVNRASGQPEGSQGELTTWQPLFSAKTKWSWDSQVNWDQQIFRRFVNAQQSYFQETSTSPLVPFEYAARTYFAQESITRSLGWDVKHDVSLAGFVDLRNYGTAPDQYGTNPAALAEFQSLNVPRSDNRVGPFLQYHGYRTRFVRILDFQTLGLQEDYRLGHDIYVRVYPILRALGSSRDVLGLYGGASYTFPLGDGIIRGVVESTTEAQTTDISDGSLSGGVEIVTPRLGFGRLVYDGQALYRYRNYLNQSTYLGGDTRLRGYPSNFFVGDNEIVSNLEFRTRPIELVHTMELGAALFYDVGDAAFGWQNLRMNQSVGLGLRALFPQLDREVFRVDFGFPVGQGANLPGVAPWSFFVAFQQAFTFPALNGAALPSGAPIF
jgi:hypothetical protein